MIGFMRLSDGLSPLVERYAEVLSCEYDSADRPESAVHTKSRPRSRQDR